MPKVVISRKSGAYVDNDFVRLIKQKRVRQVEIAEWLHISQAAVCKKLKKGHWSAKDMAVVFRHIGASDEEILKVMKV